MLSIRGGHWVLFEPSVLSALATLSSPLKFPASCNTYPLRRLTGLWEARLVYISKQFKHNMKSALIHTEQQEGWPQEFLK